jgi:hypothetical protein
MKDALSSPIRRFLQEPHGETDQKTPFFIVTPVETSNLKEHKEMNARRTQGREETRLHHVHKVSSATVQLVCRKALKDPPTDIWLVSGRFPAHCGDGQMGLEWHVLPNPLPPPPHSSACLFSPSKMQTMHAHFYTSLPISDRKHTEYGLSSKAKWGLA